MTPDQFLQELRAKVQNDLPKWLEYIKQEVPRADNPESKAEWVKQFGQTGPERLVRARIIPPSRLETTDRMVLAVKKSTRLRTYMRQATREITSDRRFVDICQRMFRQPGTITPEDIQYAVDKATSDDRLITGVYFQAFSDPDIRGAMGIPTGVSPEELMLRLRRGIGTSRSLGELFESQDLFDVFAVPVVPVVAIAIVLALAYTFVVAYTQAAALVNLAAVLSIYIKVFVSVSAEGFSVNEWLGQIESPNGLLRSAVHNRSSLHLWVAARCGPTLKRIPIPPSTSTAHLGLTEVEAILVGGRMNQVLSIQIGSCIHGSGSYILARPSNGVAEVNVFEVKDSAGLIRVVPNDIQESHQQTGAAGYCDLDGQGQARELFDPRYAMRRIAAAVPLKFDLRYAAQYISNVEGFYDVLRLSTALNQIRKDIPYA